MGGDYDRGQNGVIGSGSGYDVWRPLNVGVVNQGTIQADVSGERLLVDAQPSSTRGGAGINGGTLTVAGGAGAAAGCGMWAPTRRLISAATDEQRNAQRDQRDSEPGRELDHAGLGVVNQQGGSINLTGALNNTGSSLMLTGPWVLNGGSISNGTVVATNGSSLVVNNGRSMG